MDDANHIRMVRTERPYYLSQIIDSGFAIYANDDSVTIQFGGQKLEMSLNEALTLYSLLAESTAWISRQIENLQR